MNKVATQRQSRPLLSDLTDLLDNVPAFAALRPLFETRTIRVEDEMHDDMYEIRAELPGVDPEEDIEVTVRDGRVTITAQRSRAGENCIRSEFAYGSLRRSLPLPDGADEDDVNAVYDRGILTVSVPLADEHRVEKHIEVVEIVSFEHDDLDDEEDDDLERHEDDDADDSVGHDGADIAEDAADQQEHLHHG